MKKYILLFLLMLLYIHLGAQNKFIISYNPGVSLYNSENSMKIIDDKRIRWFPGSSIAYETENLWGLNIHLEYNFAGKRIYDVQDFARTSASGPEIIGTSAADLILACHNVDLAVYDKLNDWLSIAAGSTISLVNRSIVIDDLPNYSQENISRSFEDRLVSLCLGVNVSVNIEFPLQTGPQYVFFFSSVKLRYLHSVWFDDKGRNLSNYYQAFLSSQLNVGLGYSF
jgi:hypothetical protein